MHTHKHLVLLSALCAVTAPFLGAAVLLSDARGDVQKEFLTVLNRAKDTYSARAGIDAADTRRQQTIVDAQHVKAQLARQKREVRLQIASLRGIQATLGSRIAVLVAEQSRLVRLGTTGSG